MCVWVDGWAGGRVRVGVCMCVRARVCVGGWVGGCMFASGCPHPGVTVPVLPPDTEVCVRMLCVCVFACVRVRACCVGVPHTQTERKKQNSHTQTHSYSRMNFVLRFCSYLGYLSWPNRPHFHLLKKNARLLGDIGVLDVAGRCVCVCVCVCSFTFSCVLLREMCGGL